MIWEIVFNSSFRPIYEDIVWEQLVKLVDIEGDEVKQENTVVLNPHNLPLLSSLLNCKVVLLNLMNTWGHC